MNSQHYLISFCAISISLAFVAGQTCPNRPSGNITNGVKAELIHTDSGSLLGIRVTWSWLSSDPVECFQSPEVELSSNLGQIRRALNSTSRNNSVEFNIIDLDCNSVYLPTVRAILSDNVPHLDNGNTIFFGGSVSSPPSMLPRVCVGPSSSPHLGKVNISWDPLPCHLQNGADIADDYIIQYTPLSTGVTRRIHSFHRNVQCSQQVSGLHSCVVADSRISSNQIYSFQVAVKNIYGEGSFSDSINVSFPVSSSTCTNSSNARDGVASTSSISIAAISSEAYYGGMITSVSIDASLDANLGSLSSVPAVVSSDDNGLTSESIPLDTFESQAAWTLMGGLVAAITVIAGTVIVVQFIINYALWKRIKSLKKHHVLITSPPQASALTMCDKIATRECSAYGQVISPQTATEQTHIYESTT